MQYKQRVANSFSRYASDYNNFAKLQKLVAAEIVNAACVYLPQFELESLQILDSGCGTGFVSRYFLKKHSSLKIFQCDIAQKMCKTAQDYNDVPTINCDFDYLPFINENFQLIFNSMSMQWSENIQKTLNEHIRVLKNQGILCIVYPDSSSFQGFSNNCFEKKIYFKPNFLPDIISEILKFPNINIIHSKQMRYNQPFLSIYEALNSIKKCGAAVKNQINTSVFCRNINNTISQIKSIKDSGADECFKSETEQVVRFVHDRDRILPRNKKEYGGDVSFKNGSWYKTCSVELDWNINYLIVQKL